MSHSLSSTPPAPHSSPPAPPPPLSASQAPSAPPRVGIVSLGCPKALVDSERIMTKLRSDGYQFSPDYQGADVVLVNTCGFLDSARAESLAAIDEAIAENGRVIVTGCMGGDAATIRAQFPDVLAITGPHQYEAVVAAVHQAAPPSQGAFIDLIPEIGLKLTPRHYSYVKISEGCNNSCRFCIIPDLRGKLASRRIDAVLREAEKLLAAGTKELLIISQDTSAYGLDQAYAPQQWRGRTLRTHLTDLARELGQLTTRDGTVPWVRLHYVYPYPHVDDLIPLMAEGILTPYLDIPLQHASPAILKAMRRPAASARTLERLRAWRAICPDLAVRSSFIVGYPGESAEDFAYLLDWLEEAQLDRVGAFRFEAVGGAAASNLPSQIPEDVKEERYQQLMTKSAAISAAKLAGKIGKEIAVIIDEVDVVDTPEAEQAKNLADQASADTADNRAHTDLGASGRSQGDAPDIDGAVHLRDVPQDIRAGDIVSVQIEDADDHDLYGVIISP